MNQNLSRGNPMVKVKSSAWVVKVDVYSSVLVHGQREDTEIKRWKIKVILN